MYSAFYNFHDVSPASDMPAQRELRLGCQAAIALRGVAGDKFNGK